MFLDLGIEYYIETHKVPWNPEALHVERSECTMKTSYHCLLGGGVKSWGQRM